MKSHVHIEIEGVEAHHKAIRFETFKEARSLHINGFIRNIPPSSLLIAAEGETENINQFMDWCRLYFTPKSQQIKSRPYSGFATYNDFLIID